MKRASLCATLTTVAAVAVGATCHVYLAAAAQDPASPQAETAAGQMAPYLEPQHLVRITGGRTINLVCLGHGSPTVILAPGLGGWSIAWWKVQPVLAQRTRACAWDPAGFGFSGPSPEPQDTVHATLDLERVLKEAGVQGPYVVVGASAGGYVALRFTDRHRSEVAGLVLVDPSIPDQVAVQMGITPRLAAMGLLEFSQGVKQLQDCAAGFRSGALKRGTLQFEQCTTDHGFPSLSAGFSGLLAGLKATLARLDTDPTRRLTQASALLSVTDSSREVINAKRQYGDLPLTVLTRGRNDLGSLPPGTPGASTPAEVADLRQEYARWYHDAWSPAHDAYAALSSRGRNQLVPNSGHDIPIERPDAVISAVNAVLDGIESR